jgi:hypothetical protein
MRRASAQKCGGVQKKTMRKSQSAGSVRFPVAAAHPTSGGTAPAAPPMTMFCGVVRLSQRVDEDVEETAREREDRCEDVHEAGEDDEGEGGEREPELEGALHRHAARRDRTLVGAAHVHVDVAVEDVVQRTGAPAGEREAGHRRGEEAGGRHALCADEHPSGGSQQEQNHDARLREREVIPPGGAGDGLAASGADRGSHCRSYERGGAEREMHGRRRAGEGREPGEREEAEGRAGRGKQCSPVPVGESRAEDYGREEDERDVRDDVVSEAPLPRRDDHGDAGRGGDREEPEPGTGRHVSRSWSRSRRSRSGLALVT